MKRMLTACAVAFGLVSAPAAAATYSGLSGTVVEGGWAPHIDADYVFSDFRPQTGKEILSFSGDAEIYGRIMNRTKRNIDSFSIDASGYSFDLVLTTVGGAAGYDLEYAISGNNIYEAGLIADGSNAISLTGVRRGLDLTLLAPTNALSVDWKIEIVNVQEVPLPASALLLLGGLAGLGGLRRKS